MSLSSLLLSPSTTMPLPAVSSCATHTDHDYVLKPHVNWVPYVDSNPLCGLPADYDNSSPLCGLSADYDNSSYGDAMLSSCAATDFEKGVGESTADTDFLKDLDDLDFSFDDLNPCSEVAMEDSFQEFIDSALDQSYSTSLHDMSPDKELSTSGQDAVILSKEQFLALLELKPTQQDNNVNNNILSQSSTLIGTGSCPDSIICSSDGPVSKVADLSTPKVYTKDVNHNDQVPTRQCSWLCFESEFKAVYSIAHPINQESVMTCSSASSLRNKDDCTECSETGLASEVRMSPLFVDNISGCVSGSLQSSPKDCIDVVMEEDTLQRTDRDTADIMTWLNESQQEFQQQVIDNNNIDQTHTDELLAGLEMPNQNTMARSPLYLESFVDLEHFEIETSDKEAHPHTDHPCQGLADHSKCDSISSCNSSQLKLSVFTEHTDCFSHTYPESSLSEMLSPNSSDFSHNAFSPALSISDSNQSPFSPQQLRSMDLSFSSNYDDELCETAGKSPLALLNLFSDENATSLLHTDSTVPSIRFM
ncbi:hypothetical protein BsWGS_13018 [Bradybaena similaris]